MCAKCKCLAQQLLELWAENEETMAEDAAYQVACDLLGIKPEQGRKLLAEIEN